MNFFDNLDQHLAEKFEGNVSALARASGLNVSTIRGIVSDKRVPQIDTAAAIAKALGCGLGSLMGEDVSFYSHKVSDEGFAPIPAHDWGAEAGPGSGFSDAAEFAAEKSLMFSRAWLRRKGLVEQELMVIGVRGDSMTPELEDGDAVLIDKRPVERPNQRGIYFLRTHDGLNLKRVRVDRRSGDCYLMSSNPVYRDLIYNQEDIEILGLVVWRGTWVGG